MSEMKYFLFLFILFSACRSNETIQTPLLKDSSTKEPVELEVISFNKNGRSIKDTMTCNLALINNTFWNIRYMDMSCDYNEAFCTDFPRLHPVFGDCNKNSPILYSLGFYEKELRQVAFCYDSAAHIPAHTLIRLGFHLVKCKYIPATDPLVLLRDSSNIIWSKPIEL